MKIKELIIITGVAIFASACSQNNVQNLGLETKEDSLSYAIGVSTFTGVNEQGWEIDPLLMAKGMMDAKDGEMLINEVAANGFIQVYMMDQQEEKLKEEYGDKIEEGKQFLADNVKNDGVLVTESGLQYEIISMGEGPKPTTEDKVRVHYAGTLIDGTEFDSSIERGEPAEFPVSGVIKGWTEGLQLMPVGSKFKFYIPYDLAYGARGAGAAIQPFSNLIFEVELLDIITEPSEE